MREKRVNLVVLTCSVLVATCASVSYCIVTSNNFDRYVSVISRAIPIFLSGQISTASAAAVSQVWIPSDEDGAPEGSVQDEFQEVAHVFGRPGQRVVKPKKEDEITQQPVPWMSLKDEWKIYQKIQNSERKSPADKLKKKSGGEQKPQQQEPKPQADDDGSSEEDEEDEEEEGDQPPSPPLPPPQGEEEGEGSSEEDDTPEGENQGKINLPKIIAQASGNVESENPVFVKRTKSKSDSLPLAFYGQENHDDDERDFVKDESKVFKKKKITGKGKIAKKSESDNDEEEDDTSGSNEAASVEDYADYAVDDDDDAENDEERKRPPPKNNSPAFEEIPLAIREMILNDLANQNNGTGYVPNLTPKVTGGSKKPSSSSTENSGEDDEGSSEEEDDNNAAEAPQRNINDPDPTPPAVVPAPKRKKGDDDEDEEVYSDGGGKKGKGKKKKGKKKKGGWGWKQSGWGLPGWSQQLHHEHDGWGWDKKHDGLLEQLVKGSTWERVLHYYHWKRDEALKHEGHHGHHDDHHHDHHFDGNHPGLELGSPFDHHEGEGWGWRIDNPVKKIAKKAFQGSFWERAFHTYAHYKEHQHNNPKKPLHVDLDLTGDNLAAQFGR